MADRGRDLKVAILSDVSRFDTAKPADQLDKVAAAADRADRALDRVRPQDATHLLDKLGGTAKDVARRVDDAFDAIARTAKTGAGKLGVEASTAKRKLSEIGDEAKDTAREALASFSSFGGDLADAGQELAANAGSLFGPVGLAIGGALSAGIAIFRANAEEVKRIADEMFADIVQSGGKLDEAAIDRRLQAMGTGVLDLRKAAEQAGVPVTDFLRAAAGDEDALRRTAAAIDDNRRAYMDSLPVGTDVIAQLQAYDAQTKKVRDTIGTQTDALSTVHSALSTYTGVQNDANAAAARSRGAMDTAIAAYRDAERAMRDPIVVRLDVDLGAFNAKIAGAQRKLDALTRYTP